MTDIWTTLAGRFGEVYTLEFSQSGTYADLTMTAVVEFSPYSDVPGWVWRLSGNAGNGIATGKQASVDDAKREAAEFAFKLGWNQVKC